MGVGKGRGHRGVADPGRGPLQSHRTQSHMRAVRAGGWGRRLQGHRTRKQEIHGQRPGSRGPGETLGEGVEKVLLWPLGQLEQLPAKPSGLRVQSGREGPGEVPPGTPEVSSPGAALHWSCP